MTNAEHLAMHIRHSLGLVGAGSASVQGVRVREKAKGERAQREEIGPFFLRAHNNQRSISVHSETENKLEVDWLPVVSVCWPIWPRILLVNLTRLYQELSTCVELISIQLNNKDL